MPAAATLVLGYLGTTTGGSLGTIVVCGGGCVASLPVNGRAAEPGGTTSGGAGGNPDLFSGVGGTGVFGGLGGACVWAIAALANPPATSRALSKILDGLITASGKFSSRKMPDL